MHQAQQEPEPDVEAKVLAELTELADAVSTGLAVADGRVATLRAQLAQVFERFEVFPGRVEVGDDLVPYGVQLAPPGGKQPDDQPGLDEHRDPERTEDPEATIGAGEVTIFPVLRPEKVVGFGDDWQPVAARVGLTLPPPARRGSGGGGNDRPDGGSPAALPTTPSGLDGRTGDSSSTETRSEQGQRGGQSDVAGFAT